MLRYGLQIALAALAVCHQGSISSFVPGSDITALQQPVEAEPGNPPNRDQDVRTGSGSISGTFYLYDSLRLITDSGSINVRVVPQDADPDKPQPAYFYAASQTGSVHVEFPRDASAFFDREFNSMVECKTGSISGNYPLGSTGSFMSKTGHVDVDVLLLNASMPVELYSGTETGGTRIDVSTEAKGPISHMKAGHSLKTGSLNARYPASWSGQYSVQAITGSYFVRALGEEFSGSSSKMKGTVGDENSVSTLDITVMTGSINLQIGD